MLLKNYRKEIFRADCNPSFEAVHCFAYPDEDVSEVLPYLNAEMGGFRFIKEPPSVTFKIILNTVINSAFTPRNKFQGL
jgi:hypothetical protein